MKYYSDLLAMGCFTREQICSLVGNYNTAGALLKSYLKKGYVKKARHNLYVAINLADSEPVASKFRIASAVTGTSYVSHHSAFEYYGCANQVSYKVEVSSETPFASFHFNGNTYACLASRIKGGVSTRTDGVRVTDMERTIIDGINDFRKVMGLEELLRCLALVPSAREDRLFSYLAEYGKQALYQKAGLILWHFRHGLNLGSDFFDGCAAHIGKNTGYLSAGTGGSYDKRWRLVAPENLLDLTAKGETEYADV